jgi:putative FmdB family regulatory protein
VPTYQARCRECGKDFEYVRTVIRRNDVPECSCGGGAEKVILSAPIGFVMGRFDSFVSPVDGSVVRTSRELREHNRRNNVLSMSDGYDEKTILSGKIGKRPELSPKERLQDVIESVKRVQQGHKPQRGAEYVEGIDD